MLRLYVVEFHAVVHYLLPEPYLLKGVAYYNWEPHVFVRKKR